MDLNLALAIVAAEAANAAAETGRSPYFWPMAELVSFLITECDPETDDPAVAAIQAEPDLARQRAAEIDQAVAEARAQAEAHQELWAMRQQQN